MPGNGEIWDTDGFSNGELTVAGVLRRRSGKGIIIPLGWCTAIIQAWMTGIAFIA